MSDILFERPYALIRWEKDYDGLYVQIWGYVSSEPFREILETALKLLTANNLHRWILDIREQKVNTLADLDWAGKDWIPRCAAGGLTHSVTILPNSVVTQMGLHRVTSAMEEGIPVNFRTLPTVEEAREWLMES